MAIRLKKGNTIVFQLLRKNLRATDGQWQEVRVIPLAVNPSNIQYGYGARSVVTQTDPDAGFVDRFGLKLTTVSISGTFGQKARRVGIRVKDGYTRLLEFRDDIFKLSHQARPIAADGTAQYVYVINYYDFINDERFSIDLQTLQINLDARVNAFVPTYALNFMRIGEIITVETKDAILATLLAFDKLVDGIMKAINQGVTFVEDSLQPLATIGDAVATHIDELDGLLGNIQILLTSYKSAVSGQRLIGGSDQLNSLATIKG